MHFLQYVILPDQHSGHENKSIDHTRWNALMVEQILSSIISRNAWRTVRRMLMLILREWGVLVDSLAFSFINYRMSWHLSSRKRWIMCLNISLAEEAWLLMIVWGGKLSTDSPGCYCTFCLLGACFSNVQVTFVPADILKDIRKSCSAGFFLKTSLICVVNL